MFSWLQTIRNRLFSGNQYRDSLGAVEVVPTPGIASYWLISRGQCLYGSVRFSHIDKVKRTGAIAAHIELASPFEQTGSWVVWEGDIANYWLWDSGGTRQKINDFLVNGDSLDSLVVVPESAFSQRYAEALVIAESIDGYTGQCWRNGALVAEAFWPEKPLNDQIYAFKRKLGGDFSLPLIECGRLATASIPWSSVNNLSAEHKQLEAKAVAVAILLSASLIAYESLSLALVYVDTRYDVSRIEQLSARHSKGKKIRDETLAMLSLNRELVEVRGDSQLALMQAIAGSLPPGAGQFRKWQYDGDSLVVVLAEPMDDLSIYASSLEQVDGFGTMELSPNDRTSELEIDMRLVDD